MNPVVAGLSSGVAVSLIGLAVVWPALGRGPMALLGRLTAVFLGKLALVVVLVVAVHRAVGGPAANAFAVSLAATVVVLLLAQGGLLVWRTGRLEASGRGAGSSPGDVSHKARES